jgi:predicted DNA-binding transcriptional regulator AlpA
MATNGHKRLTERSCLAESPRPLQAVVNVDGGLLVDVRGAARLVGISPGSLYRMISAKLFPEGRSYPGLRTDKRKCWRVDDVVAWVDQHFPRQIAAE